MNKADKNWLTEHFGPHVLFDEPMWRHTTFRIGGPVDALITVKTEQEIKDMVVWARGTRHRIMILGAGSNLLVRDGGVRGLVLKLADEFEAIHLVPRSNGSGAMITAGAAVLVHRLGKYALDQGLAGLSFALGIPGAVGGALKMNAGAREGCMADSTSSIRVLNPYGDIVSISRNQLRFSYRRLDIEEGTIILSGQFRLKHADREALRKEAIRTQERRRLSQPLSLPSAGCVFRNPRGQKAAGELIDRAGLKGLRVGEAEVSTKHANFIVNKGHAKASDVLDLIRQVQETVFERFGVNLELEVTIIGQEAVSQKLL
jgi:UDP-N-acetylmuramate dehydrogenase